MREIHRYKTVKDGDRERKIQLFDSTDEIIEGMNICLESISIIRRLLRGMKYEVFVNSRAVLDRCAINYQIIGNQMGRLDDSLKSNRAMETAYGARNMVAHWYGTPTYRTDLLYADLAADLDYLEDGCREIIEMVESGEIVVSDNRKRGLFRRRSTWNSEGMCRKDLLKNRWCKTACGQDCPALVVSFKRSRTLVRKKTYEDSHNLAPSSVTDDERNELGQIERVRLLGCG